MGSFVCARAEGAVAVETSSAPNKAATSRGVFARCLADALAKRSSPRRRGPIRRVPTMMAPPKINFSSEGMGPRLRGDDPGKLFASLRRAIHPHPIKVRDHLVDMHHVGIFVVQVEQIDLV